MSTAEKPVDAPEAYLRSRQAVARRHGRTCTAVRTGRCDMSFYAVRNGARFVVYGDIAYQLEEFDGRRTELTVVSVDSFCTLAGNAREEALKKALAKFARTRNVCPLFYPDAKLPAERPSASARQDAAAIGALFNSAMALNGLDGSRFKPWSERIAQLAPVDGPSGRRHFVNAQFDHCGVNLRTGEILYWNSGFVDAAFSPKNDPRLRASDWEVCKRPASPDVAVASGAADASCAAADGVRGLPDFFVANNITEIRYAKVAVHDEPRPAKVLAIRNLSQETIDLLAKANVGAWKRAYENTSVRDGMRWTFEFVSDGRVVKRVDCFNAEPEGMRHLMKACGLPRSKSPDDIVRRGHVVESDR